MDRNRFSKIGHGDLEYWNPISKHGLEQATRHLDLSPSARILDVGCGRAKVMLDLVATFDAHGIGVDPHPEAMAFAKEAAAQRGLSERVQLLEEDFKLENYLDEPLDLVVCIGSSHAVGTPAAAVEAFARILKPGGFLLLGEGYWQQAPSSDYLNFLGGTEDDLLSHALTSCLGEKHGLGCVFRRETTREEWSAYEDTYAGNLFAFIEAHPDDPEASSCSERITAWRNAYLQWGCHTLGFGLYLMQKKEPSSPKE